MIYLKQLMETTNMEHLSHIIYTSIAIRYFSDAEILDMLNTFRLNNAKLEVTGMLLYDNSVFFQVIEGKSEVISKLYESIRRDPRHRLVTTIVDEELQEREFANWSMGFYKVNNEQLNKMEGVNDFFTSNKCLTDVTVGISKKLLQVFAAQHGV